MSSPQVLAFAGVQHEQLRTHLFPGDGLEAAAILLCSRSAGPRVRLLVRDMLLVPYDACRERRPDFVAWPGAYVEEALARAEVDDLTLVFIHSHPGGQFAFSTVDDGSDRQLMASALANHGAFHGSALMIQSGAVRARWYGPDLSPQPIDLVTMTGHNIAYWWEQDAIHGAPSQRPMAFTQGMTTEMGHLTAIVIGISGTGSVASEQINRLGFGRVKHCDFDVVEFKNLNRILNSRTSDAATSRPKADMFVEAVEGYRGPGVAEALPFSILTREAILAASQCDVLFCCVDSLEARQILDMIAAVYLLPLFDMGVVIPTRLTGTANAIADVCGRIDYVQPGRSSLRDRGVYTPESLRAEYLRQHAPESHQQELDAGYIRGAIEEAPAVISLNMRAASACVNEFIARAYPFRHEPNEHYARTLFSLAACEEEYFSEDTFGAHAYAHLLGTGSQEPLLGLPFLSQTTSAGVA
ncbi:ThiF family adenylyltransferase [Oleiagrimonas citrea]|uniref:ThiF family adenylyltransferase n=1 Tax=Oleiagrimonas citrea TaxID=1665687 RepID=A0A846ZID4_9GAMM|nr:ThiF family adenylyltransferase [Oleiagrimonas citrea]NKZ37368.1 ThiF family adenylyltransferase [Oleiagrimonas citrea]